MKTYQKPMLMAFSLGGNEVLCGGCEDVRLGDFDSAYEGMVAEWGVGKGSNSTYDNGDFTNVFTSATDSCSQIVTDEQFSNSCKFSSVELGNSSIIWS